MWKVFDLLQARAKVPGFTSEKDAHPAMGEVFYVSLSLLSLSLTPLSFMNSKSTIRLTYRAVGSGQGQKDFGLAPNFTAYSSDAQNFVLSDVPLPSANWQALQQYRPAYGSIMQVQALFLGG